MCFIFKGVYAVVLAALIFSARAQDEQPVDLIVIGAGWAGMAAADYISRNSNVSFLVLESTNRTGGRSQSATIGDFVVELGSMWIEGAGQKHSEYGENKIYELARRSGAKTRNMETTVSGLINKVYDADGEDADPDGSLRERLGVAETCVFESLVESSAAEEKDMEECGWDPESRVEIALEHALQECDAVSSYVRDSSFAAEIIWGRGASFVFDQNPRGYAGLIDFMVRDNERFEARKHIIFNAHVNKISYHDKIVMLTMRDNRTFKARQVISTIPLGVLQRKHTELFHPPLSTSLVKALTQKRTAMGNVTKVFLQFPLVWWDDSLMSWASTKRGRELASWRNLNHKDFLYGSRILLTVFSEPWSSKYEALDDKQAEKKVMRHLRTQHPDKDIPNPINFIITRHGMDDTRYGAFSHFGSCQSIHHFYRVFSEPLYNSFGEAKVRFSGEAHCPMGGGYTHGALHSGVETAAKYLYDIGLGPNPKENKMLTMCEDISVLVGCKAK